MGIAGRLVDPAGALGGRARTAVGCIHSIKKAASLLKSDYLPVTFTDAQWETLQATFPDGVCDNDKPLVALRPTVPWLTYKDGPGGKPLGDAPASREVRGKGGKHNRDDDRDHRGRHDQR